MDIDPDSANHSTAVELRRRTAFVRLKWLRKKPVMAFRSAQSTHCSVLKPGIFPHIGNKLNAFYLLSFPQSFHWVFPPKSSKTFLHLQKGLVHMVSVKNRNCNPDLEQHLKCRKSTSS